MNGTAHDDRDRPGKGRRRTKIVATLGPASRERRVVERLLDAGMDVARINLSHGTPVEHTADIMTVRRVAAGLPSRRSSSTSPAPSSDSATLRGPSP